MKQYVVDARMMFYVEADNQLEALEEARKECVEFYGKTVRDNLDFAIVKE